jgi:hypothetical protein
MALSNQQQYRLRQILIQAKSYPTVPTQLSISPSTVASQIQKEIPLPITPNNSRRPPLISDNLRRRILHSIPSGPVHTPPEPTKLFALNVCNQTVPNMLTDANLSPPIKPNNLLLTKRHRQRPLHFPFTHRVLKS